MKHIADLSALIFQGLKSHGIRYAALAGADNLPSHCENDIDLLVPPDQRYRCVEVIVEALMGSQWRIVWRLEKYEYSSVMYSNGVTYVPVDVVSFLHYRGYQYATAEVALESRVIGDGEIYFVHSAAECATVLIKDILTLGTIRDKTKVLTKKAARDDANLFKKTLTAPFGCEMALRIHDHLLQCEWKHLEELRETMLTTIHKRQRLQMLERVKYLYSTVRHYITSHHGVFVAIVGPDGSGKTTLAEALCASLSGKPFKKCSYFAMNFGILPRLGTWRRGGATDSRARLMGEASSFRRCSVVKSALIVAWYALDSALGRFSVRKSRGRCNLTIAARYFYDYYFHGDHRRLPLWYIRVFELIVAKPDIVFFVDRCSATIYRDKPELTVDEIELQQDIIRKTLRRLPSYCRLDGNSGEKDTSEQAAREILRYVEMHASRQ